jgi:NAD(P)-dependent dehydrogenase (short-subunit alcohol dehydrogenase family)
MQNQAPDLDFSLAGKVACVTGAASGIGLAIGEAFARKGVALYLIDKSPQLVAQAGALAEKYGIQAVGAVQDLGDTRNVPSLAERCVAELGKVDILVNNAGVTFLDQVENLKEEDWDRTLDMNAKVPFLLSQAFGRKMIAQRSGAIINIASQGGIIALEQHAAYCASKAALIALTRVCALEWGKYHINVNSISPTVILTAMGKNYWQGKRARVMLKKIPAGRFGRPEEVAAACVYLASDAAALITGGNLVIDGGYTIQ